MSSVGPSSVQDLSGTFPTTQPHVTWLGTDPAGGYAQPAPMSPGRHLAGQQMGSACLPPTCSQVPCFGHSDSQMNTQKCHFQMIPVHAGERGQES